MCLFCEKQAETTEQLCAHMEVRPTAHFILPAARGGDRTDSPGYALRSWSTCHSGAEHAGKQKAGHTSCPALVPTALVLTALGAWREGGPGVVVQLLGERIGEKSRDPRVCTFFIKKLEASGSEPVPTQDMLERTLLHPWEGAAGPQDSTAAGLGAEG